MNRNDWYKRNTVKVKSNIEEDDGLILVSKVDGSYLTRVEMEDSLDFLILRGIENPQAATEGDNTASVGWNEKEQKWYGWSHRAIYGFGLGSKVQAGDCCFVPSTKEEFMDTMLEWWGSEFYSDSSVMMTDKGVEGVFKYGYDVPNEDLRGTTKKQFEVYPEFGRGEWEAESLEDAKQMAIDFARGVS